MSFKDAEAMRILRASVVLREEEEATGMASSFHLNLVLLAPAEVNSQDLTR